MSKYSKNPTGNTRPLKLPNLSGLSLIEVIVSILILAIICGGMFVVASQGFAASRKSRERIGASMFAKEIIEEYADWNRLVARTGGNPPLNGTYTNPPSAVTRNNVTYTASITVSNGPVAAAANQLKQLEVTVSWPNGSITMRTLESNY
ncbi:MAG: prepilin-type N-terminal cleavage/methylation domain-containing protein [Candidatus Omnitrophica bacterium]|nr:prepilin-type N-terminal cleavage/methylation domain-containing protein [Candidatus Omnitrophota bacterium]MBU4479100.1 prepilin-type N-terminal cleavage/methylation domain-containing protein [Candidatus Omnitrophota bacterium]MCG2703423.1 prepilin-type N-terminal cleavage/methylation domain-containing protein [Candidatus Omnitrophota bacterium]